MSTKDQPKSSNGDKKGTKKTDKKDDFSPEDLKLKEDLTSYVNTIISFTAPKLSSEELQQQKDAILAITKEMREATSSMTAIPKPLKFLREHISTLRTYYTTRTTLQNQSNGGDNNNNNDDVIVPVATLPLTIEVWENQQYLADLLSVVSMVLPNEIGLVLKYRFDAIQGDYANVDLETIFKWGISYVQTLSSEIAKEYQRILYQDQKDDSIQDDDEKKSNDDDNNNNTDDDDDKDDDFDDLVPTTISKTQSSAISLIAGDISLTPSLLTNNKSSSSTTTSTTTTTTSTTDTSMSDDKKDDDKKDDKKDTTTTTDDKTKTTDKKDNKKELSDEEKAKIDAEELKQAKMKPTLPPPVTTASLQDLVTLSVRLLPHLFAHGCEIDAVDMLYETENINAIIPYVDEHNYADVLQYVEQSNLYNIDLQDQQHVYSLLIELYIKLKQFSFALTIALRITPYPSQKRALAYIFYKSRDIPHVQLQLAYMLAQYTSHVQYLCLDTIDDVSQNDLSQTDDLYTEIITDFPIITDFRAIEVLQKGSCGSLSQKTLNELGMTKGKSRDDVCRVDDEREDPYEWFAVGLANTGTKIVDVLDSKTTTADGTSKTQAANIILSKALSTGMIYIGDVEEGYSMVDPYLNPTIDSGVSNAAEQKEQSILGGVIATALCGAGVTNDFNAGLALLSDYVTDTEQYSLQIRSTALFSLGVSYLGSHDENLRELFVPLLLSDDLDDAGKGMCAIALSLVFLGSCDNTLAEVFIATLSELKSTPSAMRLVSLACGFLVLNNQFIPDDLTQTLGNFSTYDDTTNTEDDILVAQKSYLATVIDLCTHIGSGDVLLVQNLLRNLSTNSKLDQDDDEDDEDDDEDGTNDDVSDQTKSTTTPATTTTTTSTTTSTTTTTESTDDKPKSTDDTTTTSTTAPKPKKTVTLSGATKTKQQEQALKEMKSVSRSLSVLAMAFASLCDQLTQDCTMRVLNHLLECGSSEIRSAVPLAMALLHISHPTPALTDQLVRLTHDNVSSLAINATLAIGLTAAGSNNSRSLAGISGLISETSDKTAIKIGRIAQGLVTLGQGTLTLSTSLFNNSVLNQRSIVAMLFIMTQMIEPNLGLCAQLHPWSILPVCARPKVLVTKLIDNNEPDGDSLDLQIPVKMGQVQGGVILGRKTVLSGIQVTHTPVVIGVGNYVQVDDDDFNALSHCLEGTVLVTKSTTGQ